MMWRKAYGGIETASTSEYVAGTGFHLYYPERGGARFRGLYTRPPRPATTGADLRMFRDKCEGEVGAEIWGETKWGGRKLKQYNIFKKEKDEVGSLSTIVVIIVILAVVGVGIYSALKSGPKAEFEVTTLTLSPAETKVGQTVTVSVAVKNTGDAVGAHEVPLTIDGEEVEVKEVTLAPDETKIITFTIVKNVEGAYTIGAGGLTKSLNVNPLTPATFEVSNLVVNPSEVEVGEPISISATVANTGDLEGAHEVMLKIDGLVEATEGVTLEGGKSTPVSFTATLDTIGSHSLEIGELSKNVTIKPEIWEIKTASYYDHETGDLEPEGTFKAGDTIWLFTQVAVATEPIEIHTNFSFGYSLYGPDGTLFNSDSSNAELTCYDLHTWFSIDTSYSDPPGYYTFAYWIEDVDRNVRNEENVTFYLEPPSPAEFEVIDLVISPSKVEPRATVTISVIVKNIGDLEGGYTVELKIDGVVEATKDVTLTGGATETASFTVTKNEAKTYSVTVDGLAGSFTVKPFASVSRDFEWEDHLGEKWTWSIDVEQWRYEYYQGLSHRAYTTEDYLKFVTYEDGQIKAMTDKLMEAYSDHEDAANCILAFVQTCFPYTPEDEEYWGYPVETLVDNGDCEDKAVLFASIMKAAEYDVALIVFEGHVMAGVVLWNEPKYGTQEFIHWFTSDEKRYYTCETTAEGWRVGDLPEEYEGESAHVLAVN